MGQPEGEPAMNPSTRTHQAWTPDWVKHVTGGRWLSKPSEPNHQAGGLSIDSRTIRPGQVFLAVGGDQFDGHDYVGKALGAGACFAIVDQVDNRAYPDGGVLLVNHTTEALQTLARAHRIKLRDGGCHVIAVAGSNGKTTTRHLIHAVLSSHLKGTQSPKSFNNHLGVPLTLIGASPNDNFLVAEIGTNHPGEIDALGDILRPDSAVITCIGNEHMEFFKDLKGVAEEEAAITRHLPDGNTVFIESEAYQRARDAASFNHKSRVVVYGGDADKIPADTHEAGRQSLNIGDTTIDLPLIAPHDRLNALAAVRVGESMGVPLERIKHALENIAPMPGRLEVKQFGPVTLIDDSYNANPDSTLAALRVLADYEPGPGGRRFAILGDMLELGDLAETSHREVGQALSKQITSGRLHNAVLIGPLMAWAHDEIRRTKQPDCVTHYPENRETDHPPIVGLIRSGDVILLKGSRGMQLESLLPALQSRFSGQALE